MTIRLRTNQYGVNMKLTSRIAHAWNIHAAVNGASSPGQSSSISRTPKPALIPMDTTTTTSEEPDGDQAHDVMRRTQPDSEVGG